MDQVVVAKRLMALDRQAKLYASYMKRAVISEEQYSVLLTKIEDERKALRSQTELNLEPANKSKKS